ncbi:hypothetical protein GS426_21455 [Rhodococcus hoagii]|nr:hypothetical protein [Prescottella equi]
MQGGLCRTAGGDRVINHLDGHTRLVAYPTLTLTRRRAIQLCSSRTAANSASRSRGSLPHRLWRSSKTEGRLMNLPTLAEVQARYVPITIPATVLHDHTEGGDQ